MMVMLGMFCEVIVIMNRGSVMLIIVVYDNVG